LERWRVGLARQGGFIEINSLPRAGTIASAARDNARLAQREFDRAKT
jgi:hypothetical protein